MTTRLPIDDATLADFGTRHANCRLSRFSSVLEGTARPASDIDLLIEFVPGCEPGLLALAGMELDLGAVLGGRAMDLHTTQDPSHYFRDEVVRTAAVLSAA